MKILITTYGTLGGVQPYFALGKGLLHAGHQVVLGTSERFRDFVEMEYNRCRHAETNYTPVNRLQKGSDASRPSVDSEQIAFAFTIHKTRAQRRSDGTLQIKGVRFEVPSRFRHFKRLHVRYRSWDLGRAWLVDERTNDQLVDI